jgi:alkylhydroperoxidase/carboxymuconolactone decarboxylase family protein YurZ
MTTRLRRTVVTLADVREAAEALLEPVPDGPDLNEMSAALIRLAVCASVCTLDPAAIHDATQGALDAGASPEQVHETLVLVSALGVHTLMEGTRHLSAILRERGTPPVAVDDERARLRARLQGDDPYWTDFNREIPGFLDALLEHSPDAYQGFFAYCALPWRSGAVCGRLKELIAMACDATPTHRYLPGLRLHLTNAVRLGAGRVAISRALDIAAAAPSHPGVPAAL